MPKVTRPSPKDSLDPSEDTDAISVNQEAHRDILYQAGEVVASAVHSSDGVNQEVVQKVLTTHQALVAQVYHELLQP